MKELPGQTGSIEIIVLGLLAAMIVLLTLPLLTNIGESSSCSFARLTRSSLRILQNCPVDIGEPQEPDEGGGP